jgi:PIN domain nuclease of toxin-antitoxin system
MNQPILLDTCAAIWLADGAPLAQAAMEALNHAAGVNLPLQLSPITAWEIGLLARKGRFKSSLSPQRWFERLESLPGIRLCELSSRVLLDSCFLPGALHGDPADRIIAATAREYGFTVMTRDRRLLDYAGQGYLSALAC